MQNSYCQYCHHRNFDNVTSKNRVQDLFGFRVKNKDFKDFVMVWASLNFIWPEVGCA